MRASTAIGIGIVIAIGALTSSCDSNKDIPVCRNAFDTGTKFDRVVQLADDDFVDPDIQTLEFSMTGGSAQVLLPAVRTRGGEYMWRVNSVFTRKGEDAEIATQYIYAMEDCQSQVQATLDDGDTLSFEAELVHIGEQ